MLRSHVCVREEEDRRGRRGNRGEREEGEEGRECLPHPYVCWVPRSISLANIKFKFSIKTSSSVVEYIESYIQNIEAPRTDDPII